MEQKKRIETENYILRGLEKADAASLFEIMSDGETMKFITPHPVSSLEQMEKEVEESLKKSKENKEMAWVILPRDSREVIGSFHFHKLNAWHQKAEMRAVIKREYQQKGVMKEVLYTMLTYGFVDLGFNRIVGDIFEGNTGSQKLLEGYGFKKEGILRETDYDGEIFHNTVVYSLLRREFDRRRKEVKVDRNGFIER